MFPGGLGPTQGGIRGHHSQVQVPKPSDQNEIGSEGRGPKGAFNIQGPLLKFCRVLAISKHCHHRRGRHSDRQAISRWSGRLETCPHTACDSRAGDFTPNVALRDQFVASEGLSWASVTQLQGWSWGLGAAMPPRGHGSGWASATGIGWAPAPALGSGWSGCVEVGPSPPLTVEAGGARPSAGSCTFRCQTR